MISLFKVEAEVQAVPVPVWRTAVPCRELTVAAGGTHRRVEAMRVLVEPESHVVDDEQGVSDAAARLRIGQVFLEVRHRRLHWLNETARELQSLGVPFTPGDLGKQAVYGANGKPVEWKDLPLLLAWRRGKPVEARFEMPCGEGVAWRIHWNAAPLRDRHDRLLGVFGTAACGPAEAPPRTVAELVHDLRTPLQTLRMLCAAIERAGDPAALHAQTFPALHGAAERAFEIATELLDTYRGLLRSERRSELAWFALEPFLRELSDEQVAAAAVKGLALAADLVSARGWEIYTDRTRLGRLLANLLVNAVRYTTAGEVELAAAWAGSGADAHLVLSVRDTGPGIDPARKEEVLRQGYAGLTRRADETDGMGLGLAVVARLARELGLSLELDSTPGAGTTFRVIVPISMLRPSTGT